MKKILVIYASFGQGHKIAALSLQKALNAPCYDLLDFCHPLIKKIYFSGYLFITEHMNFLWRLLFSGTNNPFGKYLASKLNRIIFASFFRYLKENNIEVMVATHFFPVNILALLKNKIPLTIISIVTDLHVHRLWLDNIVNHYIVAAQETKKDLIDFGIDANKITSGYVALRDGFLLDCNHEQLRKSLSLDNKPAVLFVSSSRGKFLYLEALLPELIKKYNLFIIYGKNQKLKNYLDRFPQDSLRSFSSHERIWELMSLSSVIVTKPGGLTVFEGLYKKKLFVFTHYIPGQEQGNMQVLKKYGIGEFADNKEELMRFIEELINKKEQFKQNYPLILKDTRTIIFDIIKNLTDKNE